jgi:hypothetical protein
MPLTNDDINEFIKLYKEEFGEEISFADAKERAKELLVLLLMLGGATRRARKRRGIKAFYGVRIPPLRKEEWFEPGPLENPRGRFLGPSRGVIMCTPCTFSAGLREGCSHLLERSERRDDSDARCNHRTVAGVQVR